MNREGDVRRESVCEPIPILSVDTSDGFVQRISRSAHHAAPVDRPEPDSTCRATGHPGRRGCSVVSGVLVLSTLGQQSAPHHLCPTQHNIACESEQWPAASPAFSCAATAHISGRTSPSDPHGIGTYASGRPSHNDRPITLGDVAGGRRSPASQIAVGNAPDAPIGALRMPHADRSYAPMLWAALDGGPTRPPRRYPSGQWSDTSVTSGEVARDSGAWHNRDHDD
jgi:hypothetical protein